MRKSANRHTFLGLTAILVVAVFRCPKGTMAAEAYVPFDGPKTAWHGFDRYDFLGDVQTPAIKPFTAGWMRRMESRAR